MLFDDVDPFLNKIGVIPGEETDGVEKTAEVSSTSAEELLDIVDSALAESEQVSPSKVALAQLLIAGDVLARGDFR